MSTEHLRRLLIAYDVASDTRRNRVATVLQSYGDRIQYSVFLIDAKPATLTRLKAAASTHLNSTEDSILIADLGSPSTDHLEFLGRRRTYTDQGPLVF